MLKETFSPNSITNSQEPLVSVIVPIYNVEDYLLNALESIKNQTYNKLEVILVDDGSTDNSSDLCDHYANSLDTWYVIHKKNGGLSDARNVGIERASGAYLYFLDSDDLIHPCAIEYLVKVALYYNADLVEHGYTKMYPEDYPTKWVINDNFSVNVFSGIDGLKNILYNKDGSISSCNKLYSVKLFRSIRFPKGKLHEDDFTTPLLAAQSQTYIKCHISLYIYTQRQKSIIRSSYSPKKWLDAMEARKSVLDKLNGQFDEELDELLCYLYATTCSRLHYVYRHDLTNKEKKFLKDESKTYFRKLGIPHHLPFSRTVTSFAQRICPWLFWRFCERFIWFK